MRTPDDQWGIEAQQQAVQEFVKDNNAVLVATYTEADIGNCTSKKTELKKAIAHAKLAQAVLCIARLGHFTRGFKFLDLLVESDLEVFAPDAPWFNKESAYLLREIAAYEAKMASDRFKKIAAYYRQWGRIPGTRNPLARGNGDIDREAAAEVLRKQALYPDVLPIILSLRQEGWGTTRIAEYLNAEGYKTRHGKRWYPVIVRNILNKYEPTENR